VIVADANLLAYLVMPGERTDEAEAVLSRDPAWAAPTLWRSELRSVVHKYLLRGDLTVTRALAILEQAAEVIGGREADVDSRTVLELATRSKCSTYDCEYVALTLARVRAGTSGEVCPGHHGGRTVTAHPSHELFRRLRLRRNRRRS